MLGRKPAGRAGTTLIVYGLPPELVVKQSTSGVVSAVKESVVAGFVRNDRFYTREQAAAIED